MMSRYRAPQLALLLFLLICAPLTAQTVPEPLADGLRAFEAGRFAEAYESFRTVAEPGSGPYEGHAQFWAGRSLMAMEESPRAADAFDRFLAAHRTHPYREEAEYQRARLFYLDGTYDAAIRRFEGFLSRYPESDFTANALYWTAESLFSLGRLDEAQLLFQDVAERFPTSFRAEAARYRQSLIQLARRENELLTLLQWSHEEYLSAVEAFQRQERAYQEALRAYRTRLAGLAADDFRSELVALNARVDELEREVASRDARINELLALLRQATSEPAPIVVTASTPDGPAAAGSAGETASPSDTELREALLTLKAQALELQELLLREEREGSR